MIDRILTATIAIIGTAAVAFLLVGIVSMGFDIDSVASWYSATNR